MRKMHWGRVNRIGAAGGTHPEAGGATVLYAPDGSAGICLAASLAGNSLAAVEDMFRENGEPRLAVAGSSRLDDPASRKACSEVLVR